MGPFKNPKDGEIRRNTANDVAVTLNVVESAESTESPESALIQTQSRCMSTGLSINQSINSFLITEMSKRTSTCEKHKAVKYT